MGEALQGGRSDCGCAYEICSDLLSRFRGFCGSKPCISVGFLDDHIMYYLLRLFQHMELTWGKRPFGHSSYIPVLDGREVHLLYLMVRDEEGVRWRRELRTYLMNQGSFVRGGRSGVVQGSFGCIYSCSTCFHVCSWFVPTFIFFPFFLTDCHFFYFLCFLCSLRLTPSQIKPFWQNDCL